jgi:AraC-like DNA-binding protein
LCDNSKEAGEAASSLASDERSPMMAVEEEDSFRFSTDGLPAGERAAAVRELCERTMPSGKIEPLEPLPGYTVRADIAKRTFPGLGVMSGTICGLRQAARPRSAASGDEEDLLLAVNLVGCSIVHQGDRELRLADGDAVFATRGSCGFAIMRPTPVRLIGFRVPRRAVMPFACRLDDAPIRFVPRGTEALDLLLVYACAIANGQRLHTPELRRLAVTHIHELIAATVSATRDSLAIADGRGIRAARLRAIMADIFANLGDCDLTAAAVAQRQRVTPRYIHKLFESEGLTFSAYVLERRLSRAHRVLSEPRFNDRTISSVAFDVGFGDLSYFNRVFCRRYDATPSEIRQKAERGASPR